MTAEVKRLVCCFERGSISRRELIAGLAALCATPAAAAETVLRTSAPQPGQIAPIPVSGLDHIALRVSDLARSTAFYRDHLGGRIRSQSSRSTFLDVGSQWVALFARGAVSTGYEVTLPGVDHIAFHSPQHRSLAERMGMLRDHGLTLRAATAPTFATPTESSCSSANQGCRWSTGRDPAAAPEPRSCDGYRRERDDGIHDEEKERLSWATWSGVKRAPDDEDCSRGHHHCQTIASTAMRSRVSYQSSRPARTNFKNSKIDPQRASPQPPPR